MSTPIVSTAVISVAIPATGKRNKLNLNGDITSTMSTKLEIIEYLTICNSIRDRLMKEDRPLDERIKEDTALVQVMNLAQSKINNSEPGDKKSSLELFAEVLAEKEKKE